MTASGWGRLIGRWTTEGAHPLLPGEPVRGHCSFAWLAGRRYVVWRTHYDHPRIPDAITVIGDLDEQPTMHYFDERGVRRVYQVELDERRWHYWRDDPDFRQSFTGTFADDGATIVGQGRMDHGDGWVDDLALTYRREQRYTDLHALARHVIDTNHYMTLATIGPDGRARVSPVYFTAARHTDFYWVSSPAAHHSRNLGVRPDVEIVIFDSTAPVGQGEAVYLGATAAEVPAAELGAVLPEALRTTAGARRFTVDELSGDDLRLYVARVHSTEVHLPAGHPANHHGIDVRQAVGTIAG